MLLSSVVIIKYDNETKSYKLVSDYISIERYKSMEENIESLIEMREELSTIRDYFNTSFQSSDLGLALLNQDKVIVNNFQPSIYILYLNI